MKMLKLMSRSSLANVTCMQSFPAYFSLHLILGQMHLFEDL